MKNVLLLLCCLLLFSPKGISQQLPLYNQHQDYYAFINPGALNIDYLADIDYYRNGLLQFGSSYRTQWVDQAFGPKTLLANFEYNFFDNGGYRNIGFIAGLQAINDETGPTSLTGVVARGALILGLGQDGGLSLGFNAGAIQHRIDVTNLSFIQVGDLAGAQNFQSIVPEIGVGLFYFNTGIGGDNVLYGGVSSPQLIEADLTLNLNAGAADLYTIRRVRHYYSIAGMIFKPRRGLRQVDVSTWAKYVPGAPFNIGAQTRLYIGIDQFDEKNIWVSIGGGSNATASVGFGVRFPWFRVGYGHDLNVTSYRVYYGGTHEINFGLIFGDL